MVLAVAALGASVARADWTATGSFRYTDREFDENGFTGATPTLPIRFATVEVRVAGGGGNSLLATGSTDASGNYSIFVSDNKTRNIVIRVLTTASGVPGLNLEVKNFLTPLANYAVNTAEFLNHPPTVNINAGTYTAAIGAGAEAFNIYDVALNSIDFLQALNGTRPSQLLTLQWQLGFGLTVNSYVPSSDTIRVADNSAFNDTVIQHESGHFAVDNFSASDSPGGFHRLSNCGQDLRLAFDEGFATYFGQTVRRHFGLPRPHLYVKTTGGSGAGNLDFYFDVEAEVPFTCQGAASEVTVYATLWDMVDSDSTSDATPGVEESWDLLTGPLVATDAAIWDVMRNAIPSALNKSLEDFWDGWFNRSLGLLTPMRAVYIQHGVEFAPDDAEANDTIAASLELTPNGIPFHACYFKDQGNGAGTVDEDFFKFTGIAGNNYVVETRHLTGDANTSLVVYASDGVSVLGQNDDQSPTNKASLVTITAPVTGFYYVRSFHGPGLGIYGSYDISVTGLVAASPSGGEIVNVLQKAPRKLKRRTSVDGDTAQAGSTRSFIVED
jgi:hypothetical protein